MSTDRDDLRLREPIRSLADIQAIESRPYDSVVFVSSMHALLERSARLFPNRPALTFLPTGGLEDNPRQLDYANLLGKVNRAANGFRRLGVQPTRCVAFLLPTLPETIITLLGAETAGRACPINYMLSADYIATLIRESGASVLVALGRDAELPIWDKVPAILELAPGIEHVICVGDPAGINGALSFDELLAANADTLQFQRSILRDDIAAFYHTGGTTGAPKLVMQTHGNQVHASWFGGLFYDIGPTDTLINGFPLFHVAGAFVLSGSGLAVGANTLIPSKLGMRSKRFVADYWRIVEKHRCTLLSGGPTFLATIHQQPIAGADISAVKALVGGGSPMPMALAAAFERDTGIPLRSIYGMTEAVGLISIAPRGAPRKPGSSGWRLPYTEIRVLSPGSDGDTQPSAPLGPGETGMIALRGPHISPGYSDPELNAGSFTEDGWLLTGDLGYLDEDGQVFVTGRAKDVIIRGGHNIDPAGIEEALMHHRDIQLCAAVGQPDAHAGELPVAFVQPKLGTCPSADSIMAIARQRIPERVALPKRIYLLDRMPLTSTGKIYKPALRRLAIESAFREELRAQLPVGTRFSVHCVESMGSDSLHVSLDKASADPSAMRIIRAHLDRFALPCEITEQ